MAKNKIFLLDVTNRDGVQTSRLGLAKLEKTMINIFLNQMGVYQSEFGFPATRHESNYINANLELAEKGLLKPMILSGWCRAIVEDISLATRLTGVKHLNISMSTSEQMISGKFTGKKSWGDVVQMMTEAADYAKSKEVGIKTLGVNAEDASRTRLDDLIDFGREAKKHGADRLRYCDTLGYEDPSTTAERLGELAKKLKMSLEVHCHNDLGMAVACSVMGAKAVVDAGQDAYINTTVNGMGERAGNADLVSVILALKKSAGFEGKKLLDERVKLLDAWRLAKFASYAFGVPIAVNQPGVGANAFAHESGIHADGALKDRRNYELYDFTELGRGEPEFVETGRRITTGEYGGIKGFHYVYENIAKKTGKRIVGFRDQEEARKILELVRYANVHTQKPLTEDELVFIAKYPEQARQILTMTP